MRCGAQWNIGRRSDLVHQIVARDEFVRIDPNVREDDSITSFDRSCIQKQDRHIRVALFPQRTKAFGKAIIIVAMLSRGLAPRLFPTLFHPLSTIKKLDREWTKPLSKIGI